MLNGINQFLFKIPIVKQYLNLILFLKKNFKLWKIKKSNIFNSYPSEEFIKNCKRYNTYLYYPGIKVITRKLIEQINTSKQYQIQPLDIFKKQLNLEARRNIKYYAYHRPDEMEQTIRNWLKQVSNDINGFIFTQDYQVMPRIIIGLCKEYNIPTILIPHESIFFNEDKYYQNPKTGVNKPSCEVALCWGELQKEIFIKRGYPSDRIKVLGSPKLDTYFKYRPSFSKEKFYLKSGLSADKKTILFAAQTMDVQVEQKRGLKIQKKIILHLINFCKTNNHQLVLRCPPSEYPIITTLIKKKMKKHQYLIDYAQGGYMFKPEEAIYYSDITLSVNSTMLFEAHLMRKPCLSTKFFSFLNSWERAGIPCVKDLKELNQMLNIILESSDYMPPAISPWAKKSYSIGRFDGQSSQRIKTYLEQLIIPDKYVFKKNTGLKQDNQLTEII